MSASGGMTPLDDSLPADTSLKSPANYWPVASAVDVSPDSAGVSGEGATEVKGEERFLSSLGMAGLGGVGMADVASMVDQGRYLGLKFGKVDGMVLLGLLVVIALALQFGIKRARRIDVIGTHPRP
jgi:hypothetical protein